MKTSKSGGQKKTPWHFYPVSALFLYLYAYGIYDCFRMLGQNEAYYRAKQYSQAVARYFTNYPPLPLLFWIVNLTCGFAAPLLLLLRRRFAVPVAGVSAVSMLLLDAYTFAFRGRWAVFGAAYSAFDLTLLALTIAFFFYCRAVKRRGVLR